MLDVRRPFFAQTQAEETMKIRTTVLVEVAVALTMLSCTTPTSTPKPETTPEEWERIKRARKECSMGERDGVTTVSALPEK